MIKRTVLTALITTLAATTSAAAFDRPARAAGATVATLTIRAEPSGCHSWALNNSSYRHSQTVRLREGQAITIVNHDSVSHMLTKTISGRLTISRFGTPTASAEPKSLRIPIDPDNPPPPTTPATDAAGIAPGAAVTVTFLEAGSHTLTLRADSRCHAGTDSAAASDELRLQALVYPELHHPLP